MAAMQPFYNKVGGSYSFEMMCVLEVLKKEEGGRGVLVNYKENRWQKGSEEALVYIISKSPFPPACLLSVNKALRRKRERERDLEMEKMSWIVSSQDVDALALQSYSRKEKSLGVLVSKYCFTSLSLSRYFSTSPDLGFLCNFKIV